MEIKYYDKSWSPAFKGGFLVLFGIITMLRIVGTIKSLAVLFIMLIGMISILLLTSSILFKKTRGRSWSIAQGVIHLAFGIYISIRLSAPREEIMWIISAWVLFSALTEIIEAGILISMKNAFAALFLLNSALTFLFGYFLYVIIGRFASGEITPESILYLGIVALVFGIANLCSAYLLNQVKENN
jgi:hypothetical protein